LHAACRARVDRPNPEAIACLPMAFGRLYKRDFGTSRRPIQPKITMVSGLDKRAAVLMQAWAAAPHRSLSGAKLTS